MNTFLAITGVLIALALQAHSPALWWLGGVRVEFLPALVAYASLTMHRGRAIGIALIAGLLQDALSAGPFGLTALAFGISAILITSLREVMDRDLPWVQIGAGGMTSVAGALLTFFVIGLTFAGVFKMLLVAAMASVVTVLLFFALDFARFAWENA